MQTNANMAMNARLGATDASDEHLMWLCNECETGGVQQMRNGQQQMREMQQMWIGGATNAERAATNARDATNADRGQVQQMQVQQMR
jgi:hypothetical protein